MREAAPAAVDDEGVAVAAVVVMSLDLIGVGERGLNLEVGVIKVEEAMVWLSSVWRER